MKCHYVGAIIEVGVHFKLCFHTVYRTMNGSHAFEFLVCLVLLLKKMLFVLLLNLNLLCLIIPLTLNIDQLPLIHMQSHADKYQTITLVLEYLS